MRIVEYQPDTTSLPYRLVKGLGISAGVFSLIICALMIANHLSLKRSDPIHAPALLTLIEELKANPQNDALKEQIRELDYLARRAFFSSQQFNQTAVYLLLGGLVIMIVAFRSLEVKRFPYPKSNDPKDDLISNAKWARNAVSAAGLVLVGLALVLALPWQSPLSDIHKSPGDAGNGASANHAGPATATATAHSSAELAASSESPAPVQIATREAMLENWPGFLGAASGHVRSTQLPVSWNAESGQGIVWKTEVPKPGFSSPVVWSDRIFISGGDDRSVEIFSFALDDGALLWRHVVRDFTGPPQPLPKVNSDTGYAASTMATDGTRLFAIFATGDLIAVDFQGQKLWEHNLGAPQNPYGHGSSLVVFEDLLLVQFDHAGGGGLFGIDVATGRTRWQTPRTLGASWSSPLVIDIDGKAEAILAASSAVVSYDPRTGKELWRVACLENGEVAPTPVFAGGFLYVAADHVALVAIDVKTRAIAWKQDELMPGVSTPVVAANFLIYGLTDGGIICRNARTGEELWYEETGDGFYASPLLAGDRVYLMDRAGLMHVFTPGETFRLVARSPLAEEAVCTPAVIGNSVICRGATHLFRIGS